jgi:hypothetical protein
LGIIEPSCGGPPVFLAIMTLDLWPAGRSTVFSFECHMLRIVKEGGFDYDARPPRGIVTESEEES